MKKKHQIISILIAATAGLLFGIVDERLGDYAISKGFYMDGYQVGGSSSQRHGNKRVVQNTRRASNQRPKIINRRRSSLSDQSAQAAWFLEQYKKNPGALCDLLPRLELPDSMRRELIRNAVIAAATNNPLEVLRGIGELELKENRTELVVAACAEWSKGDASAAHEWALKSDYPEALLGTVPNFWKNSPTEALESLAKLGPKELSESLTAIVFSDSKIDQDQGLELHRLVREISQISGPQANATEIELLKKIAKSDPAYVETYLDDQKSVAMRDMVATDLALEKSDGDWARANAWLGNFEGNELTRAKYDLWRRWGEADSAGLIRTISADPDFPNREKIIEYLRSAAKINQNLKGVAEWIDSGDANNISHAQY